MIVSLWQARPIAAKPPVCGTNCTAAQPEPGSGEAQAAETPLPDRDEMDFQYGYGLSLGLISPSPPHGQDTQGCHHSARMTGVWSPPAGGQTCTPIVGASALHGVSGVSTQKPLGLNP